MPNLKKKKIAIDFNSVITHESTGECLKPSVGILTHYFLQTNAVML